MSMKQTLKLMLAGGLIACVLGGCGHYTVQKTPAWQLQAQESLTQDFLAMSGGGHVLAASDSLGYQLFGPDVVRSQYAMLRGAKDAFARAEAEALNAPTDTTPTTSPDTAIAGVEESSEEVDPTKFE